MLYYNGIGSDYEKWSFVRDNSCRSFRGSGPLMRAISSGAAAIDGTSISLSGLCVIHCLALPLLAAVLPIAGIWGEAEWVHKLFVAAALPLSGFAIARAFATKGQTLFIVLAIAGLSLLVASAFIEQLHDYETLLTVIGALTLATAHIWRWRTHGPASAKKTL